MAVRNVTKLILQGCHRICNTVPTDDSISKFLSYNTIRAFQIYTNERLYSTGKRRGHTRRGNGLASSLSRPQALYDTPRALSYSFGWPANVTVITSYTEHVPMH